MKSWFVRSLVAVAVFVPCQAQAARLFFSETGPNFNNDVDLGITSADDSLPAVPMITLNPGEEKTLYVWFRPGLRTGPANNEAYVGYSYSIEASNSSAVTAVTHMALNPASFSEDDQAFVGPPRWSASNNGTLGGAGASMLVANSFTVAPPNAGISNSTSATFANDGARDPDSRAYALGQITVRGGAAGTQSGLFFRVGQQLWPVRLGASTNPLTAAQLQFGASSAIHQGDVTGAGDPLANLAEADALITVAGEPVERELILFTVDPNNTGPRFTVAAPANIFPRNFDLTPPNAMGGFEAMGVQHSFFDVFFDFNNNEAATLAGIQALLQTQEADDGLNFVNLVPDGANPLGNGIDYDIHIQYSNVAGSNRTIDFDFSSVPNVLVNNVAIPEPSTWALTACALFGLALLRRRR
jgi:hypothetical protein